MAEHEKKRIMADKLYCQGFDMEGSIFLVNQWMDYRNIPVSVGLNVLSFFVSGCLGIPGVAMLYGIMFYQFM